MIAMKRNNPLKNQSGLALVVALTMMIVLTLIGLASMFTSSFEIRLSGNKRGSTDAFYAAEAGVQSVRTNRNNFDLGNFTEPPGTLPPDLQVEPIDRKFSAPTPSLPGGVSFADQPKVVIYHSPRGGGEGTQGGYIPHTYLIDSIGKDQIGSGSLRSSCEVREKWMFRQLQEENQ